MIKCSVWKRIAAGVAAIMLIGMLGVTARADGYEGGSGKGSITVHKLSKVAGTGTENLTGEEIADISGLGTPLPGVGFTLYKLTTMPPAPSGETYTGEHAVVSIGGNVVSVAMFFSDNSTGTTTVSKVGNEIFTDANGELVFGSGSTLEKGYYLLVESSPLSGYQAAGTAIISLPLTNAAGTGYVYDIHVYPKNVPNLPITKALDNVDKTYVAGDDASFTIDAAIRNEEADPNKVTSVNDLKAGTAYGEMKITDDLVDGLTYKSSSIYSLRPDGTKRLLNAPEYTFTNTAGALVWSLTPTGIDALITEGAEALKVEVVATVKTSNQAITNKAGSFVKKANGDDPQVIITPEIVVPTGTINILKVDAEDNSGLAGAVFAIANNQNGTTFLKKDGTVTSPITSLEGLIAIKDDLLLATTDADGKAIFTGLACSTTAITDYRLVEIASPAGYQLKEAAINADLPVVTDTSEGAKKEVTVKNYANGTVDPENPKFALPLTGGTGTIFFTIIGILLMTATIVLYNRLKKRNNA